MSGNIHTVASMKVGSMSRGPAPGSRVSECAKCGMAVWVSPNSEKMLQRGYQLLCIECCTNELESNPNQIPIIENAFNSIESLYEIVTAIHGPNATQEQRDEIAIKLDAFNGMDSKQVQELMKALIKS